MLSKKGTKAKPFNLDMFLEKTLRAAFRRFPAYGETLRLAKEEYFLDTGARRVRFTCAECKRKFNRKAISVDHIQEIGSAKVGWAEYIKRLFCGVSNLQCLCNYAKKDWPQYGGVEACHKRKTRLYMERKRLNELQQR